MPNSAENTVLNVCMYVLLDICISKSRRGIQTGNTFFFFFFCVLRLAELCSKVYEKVAD